MCIEWRTRYISLLNNKKRLCWTMKNCKDIGKITFKRLFTATETNLDVFVRVGYYCKLITKTLLVIVSVLVVM